MAIDAIAAFWGVSMLFVITPGADWAYAIAAGLRHRSILPSITGLLLGHLTATLVVAAGVAALLQDRPTVMTGLTLAGAAYLVWLGFGTFRSTNGVHAHCAHAPGSVVGQVAKGYAISGFNPKVFLLFLALLPQFTDPGSAWPLAVQIIALGLVHVASCGVVYIGVGAGARRLLRARPAASRAVTHFSGAAMVLIGAALVAERALA